MSSHLVLPSVSTPTYSLEIAPLLLGGKHYRVEAVIIDHEGNCLPFEHQPLAETVAQIQKYAQELAKAHECRADALNYSLSDVVEISEKGLMQKDLTCLTHEFLIDEFSHQTAEEFASDFTPIIPTALKAQDIWNRLSSTILSTQQEPSTPPIPPNPASNPHSEHPPLTHSKEEKKEPSEPVQPITSPNPFLELPEPIELKLTKLSNPENETLPESPSFQHTKEPSEPNKNLVEDAPLSPPTQQNPQPIKSPSPFDIPLILSPVPHFLFNDTIEKPANGLEPPKSLPTEKANPPLSTQTTHKAAPSPRTVFRLSPLPTPPANPNGIAQPQQPPVPKKPSPSSEFQLHNIDFSDENWYEKIPLKNRLSICTNIGKNRISSLVEKVTWNRFKRIREDCNRNPNGFCAMQLIWQEEAKLKQELAEQALAQQKDI